MNTARFHPSRLTRVVIILASYALLFCLQTYLREWKEIPGLLAALAPAPLVQAHVKRVLDHLTTALHFWFMLAMSFPVGLLLGEIARRRRERGAAP